MCSELESDMIINQNKAIALVQAGIQFFGSQSKLARKLDVRQTTIAYWLQGKVRISEETLLEIGEAMGWNAERVKGFVVDNYGSSDPLWKISQEALKEELQTASIETLVTVSAVASSLLQERYNKSHASATLPAEDSGAINMINLRPKEFFRLVELIRFSANVRDQSPAQFLVEQAGFSQHLALETVDYSGGDLKFGEAIFDKLARNLYRPSRWEGTRPMFSDEELENFNGKDELKFILGVGNGASANTLA